MNYKYPIIFLNIILVFVLAYFVFSVSQSYFSFKSSDNKKFTVNRSNTEVDKQVEKKFNYYKVIADRNLFYPYFSEVEKKPVKVEPPKPIETPAPKVMALPPQPKKEVPKPLNLKLKGTIVGTSENSFAIIENTNKRLDDFYKINDSIKDTDAILIDIDRNVVMLKVGDEIIPLYTYEEDKKNILTSKIKEKNISKDDDNKSEHKQSSKYQEDDKKFVVNRAEMLGSMGGNIEQILEKVMTSVDINPYIENGKILGYSVNNLENIGDLLTGRGFTNGDIIKEVNNIRLDSPEKLFELYQTLYAEMQTINGVQILLQRNGQDMMMNYTINP